MSTRSLTMISNAMGFPVAITHGSGTIEGSCSVVVPAFGVVPSLTLDVTAVGHFLRDQVGVVFHAGGDLYLIVSHYAKTGALSFFIVDSKNLTSPPQELLSANMGLREVLSILGTAVVSAKYHTGSGWKDLKLPG